MWFHIFIEGANEGLSGMLEPQAPKFQIHHSTDDLEHQNRGMIGVTVLCLVRTQGFTEEQMDKLAVANSSFDKLSNLVTRWLDTFSLARWTKSTSGCASKRIPHWSALSLWHVWHVWKTSRTSTSGPLFGNRGASNLWILCCDSSCYVSAQRVEAWYITKFPRCILVMNLCESIWILWVNFKVSNGTPWKCCSAALCEGALDFTRSSMIFIFC